MSQVATAYVAKFESRQRARLANGLGDLLWGRGGEQGPETTTCWGQGHDLILLGHASNGRHIDGVSEACTLLWTLLVLGSMSLGYPLSSLGLPYHSIQRGQLYF